MEAITKGNFSGTIDRVRVCSFCSGLVDRAYARWDGKKRAMTKNKIKQCISVREPFTVDEKQVDLPCKAYPGATDPIPFNSMDELVKNLHTDEKKKLYSILAKDLSKENQEGSSDKGSSAPITKEDFVKYIEFIKERQENMDKINEVFTDEFEDSIFYPYARYESALVKLLSSVMHDKFDDIGYFIYELDFGQKYEDGCIQEKDGTLIDLSTAEKLYDYLVARFDK